MPKYNKRIITVQCTGIITVQCTEIITQFSLNLKKILYTKNRFFTNFLLFFPSFFHFSFPILSIFSFSSFLSDSYTAATGLQKVLKIRKKNSKTSSQNSKNRKLNPLKERLIL